jgi:hypothetical protein
MNKSKFKEINISLTLPLEISAGVQEVLLLLPKIKDIIS